LINAARFEASSSLDGYYLVLWEGGSVVVDSTLSVLVAMHIEERPDQVGAYRRLRGIARDPGPMNGEDRILAQCIFFSDLYSLRESVPGTLLICGKKVFCCGRG
jgi:hypothetical protein